MRDASSGELSLITSISFVATSISRVDLLLIDEPENSLHPQWQREYVDILAVAVGYAQSVVIIATHSPILVMGLESSDVAAEIYVLSKVMQDVASLEGGGLEEVMAKIFMTFTPKNHFLSQKLVEILDDLEAHRIEIGDVVGELNDLREAGLDDRQEIAVRLVEKMAQSIAGKMA